MSADRITSRANPLVRALRALAAERKVREREGKFLCEGALMLSEALASGIPPLEVLYGSNAPSELLHAARERGARLYAAADEIVSHCSSVVSGQNVVFTVPFPAVPPLSGRRMLLLDGVADPGNLGTIIRTADAFSIDAVLLTNACADRYAPKVVRSAMGSLFRVRTYALPPDEAVCRVRALGLPLYGTTLSSDSVPAAAVSLASCCIVFGNEANGVSASILSRCDRRIHIPMSGQAESLNVAVAAGILCYLSAAGHERRQARV